MFRYKEFLLGALIVASPISTAVSHAQSGAPRQRVSFDADWRFLKGELPDSKPFGAGYALEKWRFKRGNDPAALTESTSGAGWSDATATQNVFNSQPGFAWFRTTLAPRSFDAAQPFLLRFSGVDDNATVYLNGQQLMTHQGWDQPFSVPLGAVWKTDGPNELAVLVENVAGGGNIGEAGLQIGTPRAPVVLTPSFDDSKWRPINLPHDWGVEGPFDIALPGETGKLPWTGLGWYRKRFNVPASDRGRRFLLEVDGAMSNSTVYLNGKEVGGWPYGYASWALDLTPFVEVGKENVVLIRLQNLPESSRWYPGGGIYRHVWLTKTAPVHVAHWGTQVTSQISGANAAVTAKTTLQNDDSKAQAVRLVSTVLDGNRKAVAKSETRVNLAAGASQIVAAQLPISNARLWSLKNRHLYRLVSQVMRGNEVLDRYETPFGVRRIEWSATNGFLLNGERVQLNGVCMHHDLGALGAAWNRRAAERQLQILARMGVNAIRTSHNPPAPGFLDLCDQMGFLVIDEFSDTWKSAKKRNGYATLFDQWAEKDVRALVRRDRNHPSIIAWSSGNEVGEQGNAAGHQISRFLTGIIKSEDPTRPVTSGNNNQNAGFNGYQLTTDVFGYNYKPGVYSRFRAENPAIPLYGSETASTISSRGEYFFPVVENKNGGQSDFQMSSYDLYAPPWATTPDTEFAGQDRNPFVAGEFVWTGFDYIGEPTPYNADTTNLLNYADPAERARAAQELAALGRIQVASRSSYFGIVDLAGFPKDRFYLYQARWRPNLPMAHILPHWNWPERVGQVTPVHVYTSGDEAELFVNGVSQGRRKKGEFEYRLRWNDVIYQPGEVRVVAYKGGQIWAQESIKTTGAVSQIALEADRNRIKSDGTDLSFVTVKMTDAAGLMVPRAKNQLSFSVTGPGEIVATDNGNAIDLTPFPSKTRRAYNGLALVIVRAKAGQSGPITLRATSPGLAAKSLVLTAVK
ncbi:MAG TPA: beta-galactosidase GalB [Abditibacterium sp.]|jgi:beta-galactosidase